MLLVLPMQVHIIFTQTTVTITNVCNESLACSIMAKPRVEWSYQNQDILNHAEPVLIKLYTFVHNQILTSLEVAFIIDI